MLSVSSVIKTLMAEFEDVLILGYIDDYYFLGEPARVAACYRRYNELMEERRAALNHGKGRFFSFSASASQHADVVALCRDTVRADGRAVEALAPSEGVKVLGAPVGEHVHMSEGEWPCLRGRGG